MSCGRQRPAPRPFWRPARPFQTFNAGATCEQLDLQTGEDAEGNPVLPMPAPFCGAVHVLNDAACLCDPTYTEQVPGVGQMVEMITLIGPMCSFEPKAPAAGNCP